MTISTGTGTIYSIAAEEPATADQAGYELLTFTEVAEVVSFFPVGAKFEEVLHKSLGTRVVQKRKGSVDYGSGDISLAWDPTDAGQLLLDAGADGASRDIVHSHKVEYPTGEVKYFQGQIFSYTTEVADTDSIIGSTALVSITSTILNIAAP